MLLKSLSPHNFSPLLKYKNVFSPLPVEQIIKSYLQT